MNQRALFVVSCLMMVPLSASAFADDTLSASSQLAVAIFSKSCLAFAGQMDQLRAWADGLKIPHLAKDAGDRLLAKRPGNAFVFATPSGNLIIASHDDGGCTLYVSHADAKVLVTT